MNRSSSSFLGRHEFFLRRLHSLTGLVPIGAYMVVHLLVNSSLLTGPTTFQKNVYQIHSLESALLLVEWAFIFLPILFHGVIGVWIWRRGEPNTGTYPYAANYRYVLQRATALIAFAFILWHVFHLHGWFHFEAWTKNVAAPLFGANFRPFNAASTLGHAMQPGGVGNLVVPLIYAVGVLACVFHLANGVWTAGITWGLWTSAAAQRRALRVCGLFGLALALVGLGALYAAVNVDRATAREQEDRMYTKRVELGDILPNEHKRSAE